MPRLKSQVPTPNVVRRTRSTQTRSRKLSSRPTREGVVDVIVSEVRGKEKRTARDPLVGGSLGLEGAERSGRSNRLPTERQNWLGRVNVRSGASYGPSQADITPTPEWDQGHI